MYILVVYKDLSQPLQTSNEKHGLVHCTVFVVGQRGALAQFPPGGFGETRYVDANTRQVVLSVGLF